MNRILGNIIMLLAHVLYKRIGNDIVYIKGTGKQYPNYLLYTEKESIANRMDKF